MGKRTVNRVVNRAEGWGGEIGLEEAIIKIATVNEMGIVDGFVAKTQVAEPRESIPQPA